MADTYTALAEQLAGRPAPFLFVGAGVSRRYCRLPDWAALLEEFAKRTGTSFDYYRASAGGNLPLAGSLIAGEYHDVWWKDQRYRQERQKWSQSAAGEHSAFKASVAWHLDAASRILPKSGLLGMELSLLRGAVVDGIITTNYDTLLERLFPDFRSFVGQSELLFSNIHEVGEIYKIHGSVTSPESLVLTKEDYDAFESKNPYLAAKLLTIFVEHPIIFLGYSLSDPNILGILESIVGCLDSHQVKILGERLIFVRWDPDSEPAMGPYTVKLDRHILEVTELTVPNFEGLFRTLNELTRVFPAPILRKLKAHVYDLVLTDDPHQRLNVVSDLNNTPSEALDVVLGVGVSASLSHKGYKGIKRWDLFDDVLGIRAEALDSEVVIRDTLPELVKGKVYVPTFKYLQACGLLTQAGTIRHNADVPENIRQLCVRVQDGLTAGSHYDKTAEVTLLGVGGINELEEKLGERKVFLYAHYLPRSKIDLLELRKFLLRVRGRENGDWQTTEFAKLVCLYDRLQFSRTAVSG